jgi:integrase
VRKAVHIEKLPSGAYSVRHWGPCPCTDHEKKASEPFFYRDWCADYEAAKVRRSLLEARLLAFKQNLPDPTLKPGDLLVEYVNDPEVNGGKPFAEETKKLKLNLKPFLDSLSAVSHLNKVTIERYLATFTSQTTRSIRYRDLHAFSQWGMDQGYLTSNPFEYEFNGKKKKLVKPKPNERDSKLSIEEIQRLLQACPAHLRARLLHIAYTGKRKTEILLTEWSHLDLEAGTWFIPGSHSKSKRDTSVPLPAALVSELKAYKQICGSEGRVHPRNNLGRELHLLAEKVGITTAVTPHVFRHSFASHWRGSPQVLMGLMGWTSPAMIQKYTHLNAEDLRSEALQKGIAASVENQHQLKVI